MKRLLEVTYRVTVPEEISEDDCARARAEYGFSLQKNLRRMEAVTMGLRHVNSAFRDAHLDIVVSDPVEYEKGATARRVAEVKDAARREAGGR